MNQGYVPVIPETITVHLGSPGEAAANVTVPFVEYVKNVASSEIYPTWPENAIRANMLAQISFALNRVYTEYYRSRGYDFDITSSTAKDQSFVYGRDIFENVSQIADEIFSTYVRRVGTVEPLFAQYCNGTTVTCSGLSQWGTVALANEGYAPLDILKFYYGDNIELVTDAPIAGVGESYPGFALRRGSVGNDVRRTQLRLNRIAKNYPSIPRIEAPSGVFGEETEAAVREFQRIFSLEEDGIVGRATWYAIERVYAAVKRLSELNSEGISPEDVADIFRSTLEEGDSGAEVRELQYLLSFVANFVEAVPALEIDGIFGPRTKNSLEQFQAAYGLPVTGRVDAAVWDRLYRAYRALYESLPEDSFEGVTLPYGGAPLSLGARGREVRAMQEYLGRIAQAFPAVPATAADGIFGPQTEAAVRAYQAAFGLPVSGLVGGATWHSIADPYRSLLDGA